MFNPSLSFETSDPFNLELFNFEGNSYRLVLKNNYGYGISRIRFIGTRTEYNKISAENI